MTRPEPVINRSLRMLLYAAVFSSMAPSFSTVQAQPAALGPSEQELSDHIRPALYYDYLRVDDEPLYEKKHWKDLTPQQRERIRERYRRFQELPPDVQARIRKRYEWFKNLPPMERRELREKWQSMTSEERKHFRKELKERRKRDKHNMFK